MKILGFDKVLAGATGVVSPGMGILLLLTFWLLPAGKAIGQPQTTADITMLNNEIRVASGDSMKVVKIFQLAHFYNDHLGDSRRADSVSSIAIRIAEKSRLPQLLFMAYNLYAETNDLRGNYRKALDYLLKSGSLTFAGKDRETAFRSIKNLAAVYLSGYEFDNALASSYKLLSIAGAADNVALKSESYLFIGQSLEGKNQKLEAFRNYLNALALAEKIRDPKLLGECYARLSDFYNLSKLYNKATHYKLLQRELVKGTTPIDSTALMWLEYDLQVIDLNSNNNRIDEGSMQDILAFATENHQTRLLKYEIGLIRTHYIEANKIGLLRTLYDEKYPQELAALAAENPGLYFRLKAFFCEEARMPDSATFYFRKAEAIISSDPNLVLQSNFYNRFGQFMVRQGQDRQAAEKFEKSLELARSASYLEYMLGASRQLETIYAARGDYKNAYRYSELNKVLSDSVNNLSKRDQLLIMEIDHETRQREAAAEHEKQSTIRRHYLQYSAITIGILTVFVVLIMLGSFRVPEWIIRMLGFFSFIFLFEFIILLADHKIHEITHGEPWKVLLIKIFLIAILLPLHHKIEKQVIAYLLNHKLLEMARVSVLQRIRMKRKKEERGEERTERETGEQVNG